MRWTRASLLIVSAAAAAMTYGCSPQSAAAPIAADRVYTVQPDTVRAQGGSIAGEIVRMKITQRTEPGSGRTVSPAKLSGRLFLQNTSADQTIHVARAWISYFDADGQPILLESDRAEPAIAGITLGSASGALRKLDPGQNSTELLEAEFPVAALKTGALKEIRVRLELSNVRRVEILNFAASVGGQ
jgi:hypothetical protein